MTQWSAAYCTEKPRALYKFKVYNEQFKIRRNSHTKAGMQSMPIIKQPVLWWAAGEIAMFLMQYWAE